MVVEQPTDTHTFGSRVMNTLLWTAAGVWTALEDVVHLLTTPFAYSQRHDVEECETFGDEDGEDEQDEEKEEEDDALESEQEAWMRSALVIASRIVNDTTSDEAQLKQHQQELFELMVSMGILEFATQGYKFKLSPVISVTRIVP